MLLHLFVLSNYLLWCCTLNNCTKMCQLYMNMTMYMFSYCKHACCTTISRKSADYVCNASETPVVFDFSVYTCTMYEMIVQSHIKSLCARAICRYAFIVLFDLETWLTHLCSSYNSNVLMIMLMRYFLRVKLAIDDTRLMIVDVCLIIVILIIILMFSLFCNLWIHMKI